MLKKYTLLLFLLFLVACAGGDAAANNPDSSNEMSDAAASADAVPATWDDILAQARGQELNFYMWGGSDLINNWITGYVAPAVQEQYDITLNLVPITDATEYINKVLGEKQAGLDENGTVDLVW